MKIYFIREINYEDKPLTISYSKYNTKQNMIVYNQTYKSDPIIRKVTIFSPTGFISKPKIGDKVLIMKDSVGNEYAMLLDFLNVEAPEDERDVNVGNFLNKNYTEYKKDSINHKAVKDINLISENATLDNQQTTIKGKTTIEEETIIKKDTNINENLNVEKICSAKSFVNSTGNGGINENGELSVTNIKMNGAQGWSGYITDTPLSIKWKVENGVIVNQE